MSKDVKIQKMEKKWDELYEQTHQESETASIQSQPVALVSEKELSRLVVRLSCFFVRI